METEDLIDLVPAGSPSSLEIPIYKDSEPPPSSQQNFMSISETNYAASRLLNSPLHKLMRKRNGTD